MLSHLIKPFSFKYSSILHFAQCSFYSWQDIVIMIYCWSHYCSYLLHSCCAGLTSMSAPTAFWWQLSARILVPVQQKKIVRNQHAVNVVAGQIQTQQQTFITRKVINSYSIGHLVLCGQLIITSVGTSIRQTSCKGLGIVLKLCFTFLKSRIDYRIG